MNGIITCSVKEALKLMEHLDDDDMVTLTIINRKTCIHTEPKRIKKKSSEELMNCAECIQYQNNDFFGRISLFGIKRDSKDIVHNILFPQLE